MGALCCCVSRPVDFDGEVNLYHFDLHRAVGKGAFGKVCELSTLGSPLFNSFSSPGKSGGAQTVKETLRPQIYRQSQMYQAEGCS